jgi:coatomer protein complex subunit gamma
VHPTHSYTVSFTNTLRFIVKDCDPTTGEADPEGYDDEYQVEDMDVSTSDYIRPMFVSNFAEEFAKLEEYEVIDTFGLDKDKAPSLKGKSICVSIYKMLFFINSTFFSCL